MHSQLPEGKEVNLNSRNLCYPRLACVTYSCLASGRRDRCSQGRPSFRSVGVGGGWEGRGRHFSSFHHLSWYARIKLAELRKAVFLAYHLLFCCVKANQLNQPQSTAGSQLNWYCQTPYHEGTNSSYWLCAFSEELDSQIPKYNFPFH